MKAAGALSLPNVTLPMYNLASGARKSNAMATSLRVHNVSLPNLNALGYKRKIELLSAGSMSFAPDLPVTPIAYLIF